MKCSAERLIEALIGAELMAQRKAEEERAKAETPPLVVTISRGYGALGKETGQALADRLGVRCCDRTILEQVAHRANVDVELVRVLDETVNRIQGNWWHALVEGEVFTHHQYLKHLVKVVLSISRSGGVIVGRGAHLILGPCRAFRVRIIGSPERCAERIAKREGLNQKAARTKLRSVDHERAAYIRTLFGADIAEPSQYDLMLNSDRFTVDDMVQAICFTMDRAGWTLPEAARSAGPA